MREGQEHPYNYVVAYLLAMSESGRSRRMSRFLFSCAEKGLSRGTIMLLDSW